MIIKLLLGVALMGVAAGLVFWWIARRRAEAKPSLPPLFYPLDSSAPEHFANGNGAHLRGIGAPLNGNRAPLNGIGMPLNGNRAPLNGNAVPLNGNRAPLNGIAAPLNGNRAPLNGPSAPQRADAPAPRPVGVVPPQTKPQPRFTPVDVEETGETGSETVRFVRPTDELVQLLPGRLEVLEGATPHKEIRFVRVPGHPPHVILGREIGVSPHYIGLGSPTVSRRHARFDFTDNRWVVKNLSRTNPLIVNDDELFDTDDARPLADGDRLELGEIVLRFHAH